MKTANFPRAVMLSTAGEFPFPVTGDDWHISISSIDDNDAEIKLPFGRILVMRFNDTCDIGAGEIQNIQAEEIANFIKEARALKKNVWVNCHAGICRSGAVVSLLGDLGWQIVDHSLSPGRIPNWLVYEKVRKHFPELKQSWDKDETDIWVAAKGW